jgi:hypothetical protein
LHALKGKTLKKIATAASSQPANNSDSASAQDSTSLVTMGTTILTEGQLDAWIDFLLMYFLEKVSWASLSLQGQFK